MTLNQVIQNMRVKNLRVLLSLFCFLLITHNGLQSAYADAHESEEYRVKLAFIFNFAKFIEWPPESFQNPGAPLKMCVLGNDPFGETVKIFEKKAIGERNFNTIRTKKVEDALGSQILFISSSEKDRLDQILRVVKGSTVLTVSDIPDFTRVGGIIGFTMSGDKIRFEINLASARSSKLEISSKLLKLAEKVRDQ
ncbi:MAG: YfiR family protein [Syntrophobacteraceae bacterium]